ncbi:hypothetical protein ANRL4_03434 [Anaerolineae bacterium]|nr:hypothetical protein ANRL4_03434 [Anaerolineae bacterium]
MNGILSLTSDEHAGVILRTIHWGDQENLRNWKNAKRYSFFYQELITVEAQREWFEAYLNRQDDFMLVVTAADDDMGCMGFRLRESTWDVYNVIVGVPALSGKGYMVQALRMMCSYALSLQPLRITAKVLITNTALQWYYRNGFREHTAHADHVEIELDMTKFTPCVLKETPLPGINAR